MAKLTDGKSPKIPNRNAKSSMTEIGDTSGIALNGIIVNDDYNNQLTGRMGVSVYEQMRSGDATVGSSLLAVTLPILSARWYVAPGGEGRKNKQIAEFVEDELMSNGTRTWQETLTEVLDYLVFGRMPFEIVWEFREMPGFDRPMIGLRKIARRDPASVVAWKLKNGEPGIIQQTVNGNFEIPMEKLLVFVNQKKGDNWEGRSLLRTAYKHWYLKEKLYLIDAIGAERQGLGVPKGKVPTGAKPADKDKMEELLQNLRANEKGYALLEGDLDIEFMDMKAGTTKQLLPTIQHHDRAISLNVLAQFLQLGSSSVGSFALSNDQSKLFILCLESIASYISGNFDRYLIKKLVDYNFDVDSYPELKFEKIGSVDHNALTTSLQRAIQTGMLVPQPEDEVYLRDVMDLPEKSEKKDIDVTMFDDQLAELDGAMSELDGSSQPDQAPQEDPNNPGFDMDGNPMADAQVADWSDEQWLKAAEVLEVTIKAGPAGRPLSEETKRKISEALKRYRQKSGKGGKGKGKKKTDPEIAKKRKEIASIRKDVKKLNDDSRRNLLELKAKGQKLSDQESAKMQLDLMDKKNKLTDRIDKLKEEIDARKEATAQKDKPQDNTEANEKVGSAMDRINSILDGYEQE